MRQSGARADSDIPAESKRDAFDICPQDTDFTRVLRTNVSVLFMLHLPQIMLFDEIQNQIQQQ